MNAAHTKAVIAARIFGAVALLIGVVLIGATDPRSYVGDTTTAERAASSLSVAGATFGTVDNGCANTSCPLVDATVPAISHHDHSIATTSSIAVGTSAVVGSDAHGPSIGTATIPDYMKSRLQWIAFERPLNDVTTTIPTSGWGSTASLSASAVNTGQPVSIVARIARGGTAVTAIIDIEVYAPNGTKVAQRYFENQSFAPDQARYVVWDWATSASLSTGTYVVRIGVFSPGWASNLHWNNNAASIAITGSTTTTTTTTTPPPGARFNTLPPGSVLPSDANCAARVRPTPEVRAANAAANATRGVSPHDTYTRVTGNFVGSTDEILQWVACKWGVDEDLVRAQMAKESWWFQRGLGDWTTNPVACAPLHPIGADGRPGECPESVGTSQVRWLYHGQAFENNNALFSTAYNVDYAYAVWRDCFEGNLTWLNTVERGATYGAGDAWGCTGVWFSGRWYTGPAVAYIAAVQDYMDIRIWTDPNFI